MLPTIPNLSVWGFTLPKGFQIGQHIREIPCTSKSARTFGHTVFGVFILYKKDIMPVSAQYRDNNPITRYSMGEIADSVREVVWTSNLKLA